MNPTTDVLSAQGAFGAPERETRAWPRHERGFIPSSTAQAGDNIVSARNARRRTRFKDILPALGITVKFVDSGSSALPPPRRQDAGLLHETVSNPALDVADIKASAKGPQDRSAVDCGRHVRRPTSASPSTTAPTSSATPSRSGRARHGASLLTRALLTGGQHPCSRTGHVVRRVAWGDLPEMLAPLIFCACARCLAGRCMSPDNAWMALQGIETLPMAPTRRPFPFKRRRTARPTTHRSTSHAAHGEALRERDEGGDAPVEAPQDRVGPLLRGNHFSATTWPRR